MSTDAFIDRTPVLRGASPLALADPSCPGDFGLELKSMSPLGRGDLFLGYTGFHEATAQQVELRLLPEAWCVPEKTSEVARRSRLIRLVGHECVRKVLFEQLERRPAFIVLENPETESIRKWLDNNRAATDHVPGSSVDLWAAASQLLDTLRSCHRMGLSIGEFGFSRARWSPKSGLKIDPFLCLSDDVDDDLRWLWMTLHEWLATGRNDAIESPARSRLAPRNRAVIQQSLRQGLDSQFTTDAPTIDKWCSWFGLPDPAYETHWPSDSEADSLDDLGTLDVSDGWAQFGSPTASPRIDESTPAGTDTLARGDQTPDAMATGSDAMALIADVLNTDTAAWTPGEAANEASLVEEGKTQAFDVASDGVRVFKERRALGPTRGAKPCTVGDCLGRFRLDEIIGRGGMGLVFRATDQSTGETVAVKVLRTDTTNIAQAIRRFRKEARLLGDIQNDFVTRLYDVGFDKGHHYMAMELVEGIDLSTWIRDQERVDPETALQIVADIARGLADAHASGIVHRDIKPENVLLKRLLTTPVSTPSPRDQRPFASQYHVKLTDFGIARYVEQSGSMEVTRAGTLLGTPLYMSPEQCKGSAEITPAADVYSMGITLYQLLDGNPPFVAGDAMKLAAMHCFDPPPPIQKRNVAVTDPIANIVHKSLQKNPADRYANASHMLREIQRVLCGAPSDIELHPRLPASSAASIIERVFVWELASKPDELWHYVSNTERLNRAIGLPAVQYKTVRDEKLGLRKFGSFKLGGVRVEWEEHPFEWIEGKRMGVLREFAAGPFRSFMSIVELAASPSGGTRLSHTVRIDPRNTLGRFLSKIEVDLKAKRSLEKVYRRIDSTIQSRLNSKSTGQVNEVRDAFEAKIVVSSSQRKRIEARCDRLLDCGIDSMVVSRLQEYLLAAAPQSLAQIRPIALAEELGIDSDVMVDACLVAANEGLLTLLWDILCPTCRAPASTLDALADVTAHTRCEACDVDFQSNLADVIEMVFRAHAEIRDVDTASYCIGGPEHSPHVVAQVRLAPQERLEFDAQLVPGDYVLRGPRLSRQQLLRARRESAPHELDFTLSQLGQSIHTPVVQAGWPSIMIVNDHDTPQVVRLERQVNRDNVITAAVASTLPRFRKLFPNQTFDRDTAIVSSDMTLLGTGLADVSAVYAKLGDAEAYRFIRRLVDMQADHITSHGGTVVKSVGEGLVAAFAQSEHAVSAALEIRRTVDSDALLRGFSICVALHRGQVLMTTQNDRLDYFGSAARLTQSLVNQGLPLVMTDAVFADPLIQARFAEIFAAAEVQSATIAGHGQQLLLSL